MELILWEGIKIFSWLLCYCWMCQLVEHLTSSLNVQTHTSDTKRSSSLCFFRIEGVKNGFWKPGDKECTRNMGKASSFLSLRVLFHWKRKIWSLLCFWKKRCCYLLSNDAVIFLLKLLYMKTSRERNGVLNNVVSCWLALSYCLFGVFCGGGKFLK